MSGSGSSKAVRVGAWIAILCVGVAAALAVREAAREMKTDAVILVTGFEAFGAHAVNPSWEAAQRLDGALIGGSRVRVRRLDVAYSRAAEQLRRALNEVRPDHVLCLGVAPGTSLRIETLARNRDESAAPDNEGVVRNGTPIREPGPDYLPTGLPVKALLDRLTGGGFEVSTSDDAGGYLCNHVFYVVRDTLPDRTVAGFVHVPPISDTWPLERIEGAVRTMVEVIDEAARP